MGLNRSCLVFDLAVGAPGEHGHEVHVGLAASSLLLVIARQHQFGRDVRGEQGEVPLVLVAPAGKVARHHLVFEARHQSAIGTVTKMRN